MVNVNIIDYIKSLPYTYKQQLFSNKLFASSIIKIFDEPTKRLVFDLLLKALSIKSLQKNGDIKNSLKTLLKIQLITKQGNNIFLDNAFRVAFFRGIENKNYHEFFEETEEVLNVEKTDKFENILKILVSKESHYEQHVLDILIHCELMDCNLDITNKGFEFLLKSRYDQYFFLIISAIKYYCTDLECQAKTLLSIIELSNMSIGKVFKINQDLNKNFYNFLVSLGVLWNKSNNFVLIYNVFAKNDAEKSRFILLESNFKIYAYTTNTYAMSMIKLFSEVYLVLPNLLKGNLTEESLSNAFSKGISSKQIINFIKSFALFDDVPNAVINQIEIWESKRKRIRIIPGYLYSGFLNLSDYENFKKFCIGKDIIIDKDDEKRVMIIKSEYNTVAKSFLQSQLNK